MSYKEDILRLRKEGKTYGQIQKELGCSKATISYYLGDGQRQKATQRSQKRRTEIRKMVAKIKENSGCVDCKQNFPYFVLDFDHVRGTKVDGIARMIMWNSIEDIHAEIEKCDIVCANCHRIRTHTRNDQDK